MALRLDSDRQLPSSLSIANKWPGFCRCGALEGPYATRPRGGRRCTRFVLGSCLGCGLARRVVLLLGPWLPGGPFRACAPQTFRRTGPSAPATLVPTPAQAPGSAPQPRCSKETRTPGAVRVQLVQARSVAMRPDTLGHPCRGRLHDDAFAIPLRPATHVYPLPWHRQPIAIVSHEPTITLVSFTVEAVSLLALDWRVPRFGG